MTTAGWSKSPVGQSSALSCLPLLAVSLPIIVLFGPVLATDRSLAMRDAAHFYHPLFQWCCGEWAAGRVPLWNPYENCGLPVLADASSSIFYPGKLVFLLPVDFALRYKLYLIGHVLLAAAGSYRLARHWQAGPHAAALAAIAFSCGGSVVFQYCNAVFLVGAAWLPLAALAAEWMLRERSWRGAALFGIVLALMILGGDPQMAYHGLLIAGLYALLLAVTRRSAEPPQSSAARGRQFGLHIALIGAAAVTGFALAAVQILPSSEATRFSERAAYDRPRNVYEAAAVAGDVRSELPAGDKTAAAAIAKGLLGKPPRGSHQDLAFDFSVGPWRLAEYLWPNVGGRMLPTNRRWMSLLPFEGRTWTPSLYLGLLPVLLALGSFRLWSGEARQRWLSVLVLLFTLASFGWYGGGWLVIEAYALGKKAGIVAGDPTKIDLAPWVGGVYWLFVTLLPTYIYFRYPAKLLPLVALGLSQLAALGWDQTFSTPRPKLARVLLILGSVSAAAAAAVWCLPGGLFPHRLPADSSLGPFDGRGAYYDVLLALAQTAAVALGARWCLRKAWSEPDKGPQWQTALLVLTAAEVAVANAWLIITAPAATWRNESPAAAAIQAIEPEGELPPRVFRANLGTWRPPSFRQKVSPLRAAELAQWERDTLFPKYHLPSHLSLVESYGSIKLLDYESLFFTARSGGAKQEDGASLPHPVALRLLSTEFLVLPDNYAPKFADRQSTSGRDWPESAALWKMQRTLPRAWIVHAVSVLPPLPRPAGIAAMDRRSGEVLFPNRKARDFKRSAVVETDQPLAEWHAPAPRVEAAERCQITHYSPQRVAIEAELAQSGLLVLSDAWYPGWQATVTTAGATRAAPIYRTNRVVRGVWLPAGKHSVEYEFRPASFVRGAWISSLSWLAAAAMGLSLAFVRRRVSRPPARHQIE